MPSHQHKAHKRVHEKDCHQGRLDLFTEGRHTPRHLAERLIACSKLRNTELSPLQYRKLYKYSTHPIYRLWDSITDVDDIEVVMAYYHLFNDLFFFHTLAGRCIIHLVEWDSFSSKAPAKFGYIKTKKRLRNWISREKIPERMFEIHMHVDRQEERNRRLLACIGALLHEMIPGFLYCWACTDGRCQEELKKQAIFGLPDHRYLIVDIADALQNAVQDPEFLGLEALIVNLPDTVAMGAGLSGNNLL